MITSFKSLGQSGGGGYVLPTATPTTLGGVKIGDGINVENDGTISVSGSDVANYAMALKNINVGEENDKVVNSGGLLFDVYENKNTEENIFVQVYQYTDSVEIVMDIDGQTDTDIVAFNDVTISIDKNGELFYNDGEEDVYYDSEVGEYTYGDFTFEWFDDGKRINYNQQSQMIDPNVLTHNWEAWYCIGQQMYIANQDQLGLVKIGEGIDLAEDGTISVQGGGIEVVTELPASGTDGQVVILVDSATSSTTEYIWTDNAKLVADIDYVNSTASSQKPWCVSYKSEYFPIGNTILVTKYEFGSKYFHYVFENDGLYCYGSTSADTYDGTVYYKPEKYKITTGYLNSATSPLCYYDDEVLVIFTKYDSYQNIITRDFSDFYRSGWIKNKHHSIRNTAFYENYTFYDEYFNILVTDYQNFPLKITKFKLNPTSQFNTPRYIYTNSDNDIGPFFAPTTTGQTGYVCVAGNGWTAPTWKNPSTLLNKSTLYGTHSTFIVATDEWKLLDTSFDAGNFYIYNTCNYNETTEIVDFNDSTDDGEGGMTEPTQELKVSANTDGSYDVFYGTYSDYEGGVYSYTASTHLDTVFSEYNIPTEDQTGYVVKMILRPDGLYCYENYSSCGFVNNIYSTFTVGDSVTIGKMTVFVNYEDTPVVYLSQDEGI